MGEVRKKPEKKKWRGNNKRMGRK